MSGIKNMRMWVMTEVEYDEYGNAKILRSFSKPSKDSPVKQGAKVKSKKMELKEGKSEDLF